MAVNDISQYFKLGDGTAIPNDSQFTSMSANTKIVNTESGDAFKKVSGFSNVFDRVESHGDAVTYSPQTGFTNEQKAQARTNIGAMSASEGFGKRLRIDTDHLYLDDQFGHLLSYIGWEGIFSGHASFQQGYFKVGRLKIQYFMAPPNEFYLYPYGSYNLMPIAFVSRCKQYIPTDSYETYCSDYIGIVNAGRNGEYLSWTQDNHDDYYPILVIGEDDGTTTPQNSQPVGSDTEGLSHGTLTLPTSEGGGSGSWILGNGFPSTPNSSSCRYILEWLRNGTKSLDGTEEQKALSRRATSVDSYTTSPVGNGGYALRITSVTFTY